MKAENLAKMSAPTSKDSLFSGLRWGYLQGRGEWRSLGVHLRNMNKTHFTAICTMIKRSTWEGLVFAPETPRFWWSLFWGCHCRGGKEGWCRGPGLSAQLASWRGQTGWRNRIDIGAVCQNWEHLSEQNQWSSGGMISTLAVGLAIKILSIGSGPVFKSPSVCVLWITQLSASFQSFLILFACK